MNRKLTTVDHSRDAAGLTYVYPVLSRRAGGLSLGVNLNPNNACNWRCIYCQVPDLIRGSAPEINLVVLESELREFLRDVIDGDFYERFAVAPEYRQVRDIAISGNGEPTTAKQFEEVIDLIVRVIQDYRLIGKIKIVLITNGSLIHKLHVQRAIQNLSKLQGEVWFKLDSATDTGIKQINNAGYGISNARRNLELAANFCPTWLQTCVFALDGDPIPQRERNAYINFIKDLMEQQVPLKGVLLYGLARPSLQPEAPRLSALPVDWLEAYAAEIRASGVSVKVSI